MATGNSTKLTGQIGEQLVSAVLGTKGFYATPFSGNVPGFDLIATHAETLESIPVQVKTSNGGTLMHSTITKWVDLKISEKGVQTIGKPVKLAHPNLIWVMVLLENQNLATARFFIATALQVQNTVIEHYQKMLFKHNGVRPRNPRTLHCALFIKDLVEFEDNWSLFETKIAQHKQSESDSRSRAV